MGAALRWGMGVRRHEDLVCWQLSMELHGKVAEILGPAKLHADPKFCEQLLRSSGGAAPNIAEGFARYSKADFSRFLRIALGSLAEAKTHIMQGRQRSYFTVNEYDTLLTLARRAAAATARLRKSLPGPPTGRDG